MHYFEKIAEHNKALIKPLDSDMIYYSELHSFFSPNAFRSLSVKYVLEQEIRYESEGKEYRVGAGHYMLACKHADARAYFESGLKVKSICIDICPRSFAEAYTVLHTKEEAFDNYLAQYFTYPEFFENINDARGGVIGEKLQALTKMIDRHETSLLSKEWFLQLAEEIVYKEYGNYLALKDIHSVRPSTRKEIFRRLSVAKTYMDENFLHIGEIRDVARQCFMSEYHFFRCFKQAFKVTPFQYLTAKKLAFAHNSLRTCHTTISDVAFACNYPDAFTFSKAFKRHYGYAPSFVKRSGTPGQR